MRATVVVSFKCPYTLYRYIRIYARMSGRNVSDIIREAVIEYLRRRGVTI